MSHALSRQALNAVMAAPAIANHAVAPANPWSMVPPLGDLDAYISAVNRLPMLTLEQEQEFSKKLKENNDLDSAGKLILSHLRLVVSISGKYLG
jgi:RNA polymerase sigma-32 factor